MEYFNTVEMLNALSEVGMISNYDFSLSAPSSLLRSG